MKISKLIGGILISLLIVASVPSALAEESNGFNDVDEDYIYYDAVLYLQSESMIQGYPDGSYRPEEPVTRGAFIKTVINSKYSPEEIRACLKKRSGMMFSDVPRGAWFGGYICMAKELGIIGGYPDGTFKPSRLVNVAEASKIISMTYGFSADTSIEPWYRGYVEELEERKALPTTLESIEDRLSRGEMAEILYRLLENITSKSSETYESLSEEEDQDEEDQAADLTVSDIYIDSEETVQGTTTTQAWVGFKVENIYHNILFYCYK